jgi:hypothetical protein
VPSRRVRPHIRTSGDGLPGDGLPGDGHPSTHPVNLGNAATISEIGSMPAVSLVGRWRIVQRGTQRRENIDLAAER